MNNLKFLQLKMISRFKSLTPGRSVILYSLMKYWWLIIEIKHSIKNFGYASTGFLSSQNENLNFSVLSHSEKRNYCVNALIIIAHKNAYKVTDCL